MIFMHLCCKRLTGKPENESRRQHLNLKKRVDSLPVFPRSAVQTSTEARLTSVFEMGTGEPRPYGRPFFPENGLFINITIGFS